MNQNAIQAQQMRPGDYVAIVARRKWSLILPFLLVFLMAAVTAFLLPAIYISSSTILIEEQQVPDDFVISRMTFQARYRWEIAPLSDLFIVYTRGSNLPRNEFATFQDLLERSWNDRIVDTVAVKLRYRF